MLKRGGHSSFTARGFHLEGWGVQGGARGSLRHLQAATLTPWDEVWGRKSDGFFLSAASSTRSWAPARSLSNPVLGPPSVGLGPAAAWDSGTVQS